MARVVSDRSGSYLVVGLCIQMELVESKSGDLGRCGAKVRKSGVVVAV